MKLKILPALVCVLFCFAVPAAAQKVAANNPDVISVLKKYDDAWNGKYRAAVDKILAPEYIYFSSTGGMTSRKRTLEFLVSPGYKLDFVERSEITSYRTGDTVVISSRWKGKGTYDKEEINDDQRCSLIFSKLKGQWKLASEHCTQISGR